MKKVLSAFSKLFLHPIPLPSFLISAIILATGYGTYRMIVAYPDTFGLLKGPSIIKKEEKALVNEISKSLTLPKDEEPTIATVSEPEKLADQNFFKNAQKGDKVLIYQNSKKVILYRPSQKTVVEVGVVNIKQEGGEIKVADNYKYAILDSTKDPTVVSTLESKIGELDSSSEVVSQGLSQLTYTESMIVDVKGDKGDFTKSLAQGLGVKVGAMPAGEKSVDGVDFIILVGSDKLP